MVSETLRLVRSDIRREWETLSGRGVLRRVYVTVFSPSLHALYLYRLSHGVYVSLRARHRAVWLIGRPAFEVVFRLMRLLLHTPRGLDIPYEVDIGKSVRLVHAHDIVLTPQTRIGDNCVLFNSVTCGVNHADRSGYPVLGNSVILYPGARVIGNVRVGDVVIVGPNSVVIRDIPSNCLAVGIPAVEKKKIATLEDLSW